MSGVGNLFAIAHYRASLLCSQSINGIARVFLKTNRQIILFLFGLIGTFAIRYCSQGNSDILEDGVGGSGCCDEILPLLSALAQKQELNKILTDILSLGKNDLDLSTVTVVFTFLQL